MITIDKLSEIKRKIDQYVNTRSQIHLEEYKEGSWRISKGGDWLYYEPEPTAVKLHDNKHTISAVLGCIGSGKSTMCCLDPVIYTVKHMPACKDGVKRSKGCVARATFRQLMDTTWLTWLHWFGELGLVKTRTAPNPEFKAKFNYKLANGENGKAEIHVLFRAFENPLKARDDAGSLELSWVYINEARDLKSELVLNALSQRVGRYPYRQDLQGTYKARVLLDTNAPDTLHWFYDRFENRGNEEQIIYKQPPGLIKTENGYVQNKHAENLSNLEPNYYLNKMVGLSENEIRVQLCGEYGSYQMGEVVYPNYSDAIHCYSEVEPSKKLKLTIGMDFGTNTAAVVTQFNPVGQLAVIAELFSQNTYLEEFVDDVLFPWLHKNAKDFELHFVVDPSGKASTSSMGISCESLLRQKIGEAKVNGYVTLGLSNKPVDRVNAVDHFLKRMAHREPAFKIAKDCKYLRKGFMEEYIKDDDGKPSKKCMTNHVHDCLQYAALEFAYDFDTQEEHYNIPKPTSKRLSYG